MKVISPMLATLVDKPFDDPEWLFEIKWDGFRALAYLKKGEIKLLSRNHHLLNDNYPLIVSDLKKINEELILDGEIVVVDKQGRSSFQWLQNYQNEKGSLFYYVFDLLYKDGEDLRSLPLIQRKKLLKKTLPHLTHIRYCDHVLKEGKEFFKAAKEQHLEGMIGKKMNSTYQSKRSRDWVKVKTPKTETLIIGGFTTPRGSRKNFGALLIGIQNEKKELEYVGRVGGGFDEKALTDVYEQLKPLITKKCPFKTVPRASTLATWVLPKLTCKVTFTEWTNTHSLRHPVFQGLQKWNSQT